jgi:prepilin-type N-terminal cleavage/methylation domain-containing protein
MSKGFTLIELLVTLAVIGIVVTIVGRFSGDTFYFSNIFSHSLNTSDQARRILRPMADEIRSISPSSAGAYPIEQAASNAFVFFSDIDNDGLKERVRYYVSGTLLKKGIIKPTGNNFIYDPSSEIITDVVEGVQNGTSPIFEYYDTNYDGTTNPLVQPVIISTIRLVKVTFIIDEDVNRTPGPMTVMTQISMRNLKDNL